MLALFPNLLETKLPILKPTHVKMKLVIENKHIANILFWVIAVKARPVENASIETPKANKNIPKKISL